MKPNGNCSALMCLEVHPTNWIVNGQTAYPRHRGVLVNTWGGGGGGGGGGIA